MTRFWIEFEKTKQIVLEEIRSLVNMSDDENMAMTQKQNKTNKQIKTD